jgi:hypothetical protein
LAAQLRATIISSCWAYSICTQKPLLLESRAAGRVSNLAHPCRISDLPWCRLHGISADPWVYIIIMPRPGERIRNPPLIITQINLMDLRVVMAGYLMQLCSPAHILHSPPDMHFTRKRGDLSFHPLLGALKTKFCQTIKVNEE